MEISITKKTIQEVIRFMEEEGLVAHMNDAGLSFAAMAFILTELSQACDRAMEKLEEEDETINA